MRECNHFLIFQFDEIIRKTYLHLQCQINEKFINNTNKIISCNINNCLYRNCCYKFRCWSQFSIAKYLSDVNMHYPHLCNRSTCNLDYYIDKITVVFANKTKLRLNLFALNLRWHMSTTDFRSTNKCESKIITDI